MKEKSCALKHFMIAKEGLKQLQSGALLLHASKSRCHGVQAHLRVLLDQINARKLFVKHVEQPNHVGVPDVAHDADFTVQILELRSIQR